LNNLQNNGVTIHREIHLSDKPDAEYIVFIHGLGLDLTTWKYIIPLIKEEYNIVLYDLRGHGLTAAEDIPFTWDLMCEDLNEVISDLKMKCFHLVGHAIGGIIGIYYSLKNVNSIISLTLISTPGVYSQNVLEKSVEFRQSLASGTSIEPLSSPLVKTITNKPSDSQEVHLLHNAYQRVKVTKYFELMHLFLDERPSLDDFSQLHVPTLVIAGSLDTLLQPYLSGAMSSLIPKSTFITIANSSNVTFIDQPQETAQKIIDFLKSPDLSTPSIEYNDPLLIDTKEELFEIIKNREQKKEQTGTLKIQVLTTFRVYINDKEVLEGWNKRNAKKILIYLLLHPTSTREELYDEFWPNHEISKAQNNLRVSLNYLNKLICTDQFSFLLTDREHIYLKGEIQSDLSDFIEMLQQVANEESPKKREKMFLDILENLPFDWLRGYYDNWILTLRDNIERKLLKLTEDFILFHQERINYEKAMSFVSYAIFFRKHEIKYYDWMIELLLKSGKQCNTYEWEMKKQAVLQELTL
jgi:pimeloyl-ACP methyl ester carboxylesterase/DNA-binding SARP family transcriptional activator